MINENSSISNFAIPPGEYLEEVIEELGMSKDELAKRMARPAPKLSSIFKGEKAITPETALQLEKVVGVPAHIWIGLETEYRLSLARRREEDERAGLKEQAPLLRKYCYRKLVGFGYCEHRSSMVDKVLELQRFLGVTSLDSVPDIGRYQAAFRAGSTGRKLSPEATTSWLRMAELSCRDIECAEYSSSKLRNAFESLKKLTLERPERVPGSVRDVLSNAGVCFTLIPHLPGTYAQGATFWLTRRKPVVAVTIRYAWADVFWFSLFHEIGHLLLHSNESLILEYTSSDRRKSEREYEADRFAANELIPSKSYSAFANNSVFTKDRIRAFGSRLGIHPGIIVGRLKHDKLIPLSWHNDLRQKYQWARD